MNMQDFYTGHAFDAYEFFGAHTYFGGTHFAVEWLPPWGEAVSGPDR